MLSRLPTRTGRVLTTADSKLPSKSTLGSRMASDLTKQAAKDSDAALLEAIQRKANADKSILEATRKKKTSICCGKNKSC